VTDETQAADGGARAAGDVTSVLPNVGDRPTGPDRVYEPPSGGGGLPDEHPEALVGAAFVGGLVVAKLLKRLGG
jgi:hypothetical protein